MLIRNEYTVKEILWNCGFNDEIFFQRQLKNITEYLRQSSLKKILSTLRLKAA